MMSKDTRAVPSINLLSHEIARTAYTLPRLQIAEHSRGAIQPREETNTHNLPEGKAFDNKRENDNTKYREI